MTLLFALKIWINLLETYFAKNGMKRWQVKWPPLQSLDACWSVTGILQESLPLLQSLTAQRCLPWLFLDWCCPSLKWVFDRLWLRHLLRSAVRSASWRLCDESRKWAIRPARVLWTPIPAAGHVLYCSHSPRTWGIRMFFNSLSDEYSRI